ncbi:MAG: SIR2 family protein [Proteobacteria bacterium]|nr:SIR2 family protein [Pseudomonadota bacterium]
MDEIAKQVQSYYKEMPVIVLGCGASAAFGISGMKSLAMHLVASIDSTDRPDAEQEQWSSFTTDLSNGVDLETSLQNNRLSEELTRRVIISTWDLINPEDLGVFYESLLKPDYYALGKLLGHMFDSTQSKLDVITTNYDRLVEYACEQEALHHYTGFTHGYRRVEIGTDALDAKRTVNIWKVHGSLDWFKGDNGLNVALTNVEKFPENLTPLIVTPGNDKYEKTNREPFRTIIASADMALTHAKSYLCVGYGFNDIHIQEKLVNKCVREGAGIIVISRSLSDSAQEFLFNRGVTSYVALYKGSADNKTMVYSSEHKSPVELDGDYWSLPGFLQLIM